MKNRLMKIGVLVCVVLCAAAMVSAQDVSKGPVAITSMKPPARVAIHAGRLLDTRTGNYATNVFILVEGDRIVSVGSSAPAGVEVIDLSGQTVLPGLADCHAHILGNPKDQSAAAPLRMSSPMAALWGVRNLQIWLDHGFTSMRDAGESDAAYGQIA